MKNKLLAVASLGCSILNIAMFVLAIRHRHDPSGIVWAILWVGEQIHLPPPAFSTLFRKETTRA